MRSPRILKQMLYGGCAIKHNAKANSFAWINME